MARSARLIREIIRTVLLCWSMTWRAVLAMTLGVTLVGVVESMLVQSGLFGPFFTAMAGVLIGLPAGVLAGSLLGLVTSLWFDPPRAPRRYRQLMGVLGAMVLLGVALVFLGPHAFYQDQWGNWRIPGDMLGGWVSFCWQMLGFTACGWVAGWWGARAHLARWARAEPEMGLPDRPVGAADAAADDGR